MDKVTLYDYEIAQAKFIARQRQTQNEALGRKHRHGFEGDGLVAHEQGCFGEMAVAKYLNVFWSGNIGNLKADDVGPYQVRATVKDHHKLILHDDDPADRIFILVTGALPTLTLRGWIHCFDGRQGEYWSDPKGNNRWAYFVPQARLEPMSRLEIGLQVQEAMGNK